MDRIATWTIIRVAFCGLCKAASQVVLVVKKPPPTAGDTRDMGSIPVSGRFPGERNGNLPGAAWGALPVAKVMGKEARHTQRRDRASGVPWIFSSIYPQTRVCLLSALCSHLHLWLYRGCPPLPLSEKRVSLQLQLIIPGCDSVSTYKLLWKSSSLPE